MDLKFPLDSKTYLKDLWENIMPQAMHPGQLAALLQAMYQLLPGELGVYWAELTNSSG